MSSFSRNKLQEELFKHAQNGQVDEFLAALPEGTVTRPKLGAGTDRVKRSTSFMTNIFKKDFDLNVKNENGYTLLHVAALNGQHDFVEKLLEINVETLVKDNMGNSALHLAAWNGHVEIVSMLLKTGTNVNDVNLEGNTPLHFTAQYGKDNRTALELLKGGANSSLRNKNYETPLDLASRFGRVAVAQELATAEILEQIYRRGERPRSSPLHLAAGNGHVEIVKTLLKAGVDINVLNFEGSTALHEATQFGKRAVVLLLLQSGASVVMTNDRQQTPLKLFYAFNGNAQNNPIMAMLMAAEAGTTSAALEEIMASASSGAPLSPAGPAPTGGYPRESRSFSTSSIGMLSSTGSSLGSLGLSSVESPALADSSNNANGSNGATNGDTKIRARAVIQNAGSAYDTTVLSFDVGDIVVIEEQNASGWWRGIVEKTGKRGEFKAHYVELLAEDEDAPSQVPSFVPPPQEPVLPVRPISTVDMQFPSGRDNRASSFNSRTSQYDLSEISSSPPSKKPPIAVSVLNGSGGLKARSSSIEDVIAPANVLGPHAKWIERWLFEIQMDRYLANFVDSGYDAPDAVVSMGPGDLEMLGITMHGHRKKLLLAIDKLKSGPLPTVSPSATYIGEPVAEKPSLVFLPDSLPAAPQPQQKGLPPPAQAAPSSAPGPKRVSSAALPPPILPPALVAKPSSSGLSAPVAAAPPTVASRPQISTSTSSEIKSSSNNELANLLDQVDNSAPAAVAGLAENATASSPTASNKPPIAKLGLPKPPPAPAAAAAPAPVPAPKLEPVPTPTAAPKPGSAPTPTVAPRPEPSVFAAKSAAASASATAQSAATAAAAAIAAAQQHSAASKAPKPSPVAAAKPTPAPAPKPVVAPKPGANDTNFDDIMSGLDDLSAELDAMMI